MRLIDKDKLKLHKFLKRKPDVKDAMTGSDIYMAGWDGAIDMIVEYEPIIEVVHCKDCKWWQKTDKYDGIYGCCEHLRVIIDKPIFVNEDFFCADGEEKGRSEEND